LDGLANALANHEFRLAVAADDPGADTVTQWTIDWGDGTASQAVTGSPTYVTKTYSDNPSSGSYYTITASATNDDGTFDLLDSGTAGALDASFGDAGRVAIDFGGGSESATDAAIDAHGRIVTVGNGGGFFIAARFAPNGTLDTTFGTEGHIRSDLLGTDHARAVAIDSQGRILVAGSSQGTYNSVNETYAAVARYLVDGSLDTSFGDDGVTYLNLGSGTEHFADLVVLSDDSIVLAATARNSSTSNDDFTLVKLDHAGVFADTFGTSGTNGIVRTDFGSTDTATALLLLADGDLLVTGSTGTTTRSFAAARYSPAGALRTSTFGTSGKVIQAYSGGSAVNTSAVELADGSLVLGGTITVSGNQDFGLLKLDNAGVVQGSGWVRTAVGTGNDGLQSLAVDVEGGIVASGYRANGTSWSATYDMALMRYDAALDVDTDFGTSGIVTLDYYGRHDSVQKLLTDADGKLLAAGYTQIRANYNFAVARFLDDGTLDVSFNGGTATADFASESSMGESVAIDELGRIVALASGAYNIGYPSSTTGSYHLARLWGDGSLDASFGQEGLVTFGTGSTAFEYDRPRQLRLLEDGNMLVAGEAGYFSPAYLMRLTETGELDTSFGANQTGIATTDPAKLSRLGQIAVNAADGSIFVAGSFLTSSYDWALSLAKFTAAGVVDTTFGNQGYIDLTAAVGNGLEMEAIAFQSDGKILIAGTGISNYGSQQAAFITRFNSDGTLDINFGVSGGVQALQYGSENTTVRGMLVLPDDKILLSGTATSGGYPPTASFVVMRLEPNGILDTTFGPTATPGMTAALVASDGEWNEMSGVPFGLLVDRDQRILQVGMASNEGTPIMGMARFTSAGILDTTFADGGVLVNDFDDPADFYGFHRAVAEDRYGRYVIAGTGTIADTGTGDDLFVSRYHSGSDGLRAYVNARPEIVAIDSFVANEGELVSLTISASDPEATGPLSFELVDPFSLPDGAYLSAEGEFTWLPTAEDAGSHTFTVRVTDAGSTAASSEMSFTIEVNARPVIGAFDFGDADGVLYVAFDIDEPQAPMRYYSFAAAGTDAYTPGTDDDLVYTLLAGPPEMTIHPTTGAITYTPFKPAQPASYNVVVKVEDALGLSSTATRYVSVGLVDDLEEEPGTPTMNLVTVQGYRNALEPAEVSYSWLNNYYEDAWGSIAIRRWGDLSESLTVAYSATGSAGYGTDYLLGQSSEPIIQNNNYELTTNELSASGQLTFAPHQDEIFVTIYPLFDTDSEGLEDAIFSISIASDPTSSYTVDSASNSRIVLRDFENTMVNQTTPLPTLSTQVIQAGKEGESPAILRVTRTDAQGATYFKLAEPPSSSFIDQSGPYPKPADYAVWSGTGQDFVRGADYLYGYSFQDGQTTKDVSFWPLRDAESEPTETIVSYIPYAEVGQYGISFGDPNFSYYPPHHHVTIEDGPSTTPQLGWAPVARDDAFATAMEEVLTGNVLTNDLDYDLPLETSITAHLLAELLTEPDEAATEQFELFPDGSFNFTPKPGWTGQTTFTYRAFDGDWESNVATVSLTSHAAPVANDNPTYTCLRTILAKVCPSTTLSPLTAVRGNSARSIL
jgi:uncharacterized delta-60 repeat protein